MLVAPDNYRQQRIVQRNDYRRHKIRNVAEIHIEIKLNACVKQKAA